MSHSRQVLWTLVALVGLTAGYAAGQTTRPASEDDSFETTGGDRGPGATDKGDAAGGEGAAKDGEKETTTQPAERRGDGGWFGGGNYILFVMLGGLVLLFVMTSRSKKKQQHKRNEMLATLKKGDKVTSIGGIVGTVIETREDEITVKVDEQNNVRMRFARWAIRGVGDAAKKEGPDEKK
ncbi:MAG TPA: preprotein translocase subunit YajC [Phycisphaerae bacterium]|nr:preprotein translocase subunit YajC [Phycisphaerae bacterium]